MASPQKLVEEMKMKLFMACLLGLSFGISALPAQALSVSFGNYDRDHDGRWDRTEYYNAHRDWHRQHDHRYLSRDEVYRQYGTYDRDGDGYLSPSEVTTIHRW
jgi:Ca2+-binding EF-hand superfamily protein